MNREKKKVCAFCRSDKNVEFLIITECSLCGKCKKKLAKSFELAMTKNREDYPDI